MVLLERIELSTSPLPRECSTSELQQPVSWGVLLAESRPDASAIWTLPDSWDREGA